MLEGLQLPGKALRGMQRERRGSVPGWGGTVHPCPRSRRGSALTECLRRRHLPRWPFLNRWQLTENSELPKEERMWITLAHKHVVMLCNESRITTSGVSHFELNFPIQGHYQHEHSEMPTNPEGTRTPPSLEGAAKFALSVQLTRSRITCKEIQANTKTNTLFPSASSLHNFPVQQRAQRFPTLHPSQPSQNFVKIHYNVRC